MMNADQIRMALETGVDVPEEAMREAVRHAGQLAPAVIEVAQAMADGRFPLPHEERLLRFGLHALSVARETSLCPAFLALLRRPPLELEWLLNDLDRTNRVVRLLLGLFDGDDAAVRAIAADPLVDEEVRAGLLEALARLAWEGRASREALVELLDRFDREELAPPKSWAWYGWQSAVMHLGLTDWIGRLEAACEAGREIPMFEDEQDREDWIERVHAAAEHPDDPQRFIDDCLVPYDDPAQGLGWSADPAGGPEDPLSSDETTWLDVVLWRRVGSDTMCLEWADGFLTALAVGPVRLPAPRYLAAILGGEAVLDTPQHDACAAALFQRHLASMEQDLADGEELEPLITPEVGNLEGSLWAQGYLTAVEMCKHAWKPLIGKSHLVERLIVPLLTLIPDAEVPGGELSLEQRQEVLEMLPVIIGATWSHWHGEPHPLLEIQREHAAKIGRNDPCPCGSGKKYKRCCGAVA